MSGIEIRLGFGFKADPFGSSQALMKKTTGGLSRQADEKVMEDKQNELIERAIFG